MIDVPSSLLEIAKKNAKKLEKSLLDICEGNLETIETEKLDIFFCFVPSEIEEMWKDVIRRKISRVKDPNQAVITEKVFLRQRKQPYLYNEMKFGSKSEIGVAQELETRKVLFFPLPLAVRAETGKFYQDHREVDFLICHDGVWGILEIAYHSGRYEKDKEKDSWFKTSGILCIEHYTAEKCFNAPKKVVDEFLEVLAKCKR